MNKMKIIPMLVTAMFLSLAFSTTGTAGEIKKEDGNIAVKVSGFIGLVAPRINFTEEQINQTNVTFKVNITYDPEDPANDTYVVEDDLIIYLDINDTTNRSIPFIWKRSLGYSILLVRDKSKIETKPIIGYLRRLIAKFAPLKSVPVLDSVAGSMLPMIGKKADNITIPIKYEISNSTYQNVTENMTLYINTMGLLPGDINGMTDKLPILDLEKITLQVTYEKKE